MDEPLQEDEHKTRVNPLSTELSQWDKESRTPSQTPSTPLTPARPEDKTVLENSQPGTSHPTAGTDENNLPATLQQRYRLVRVLGKGGFAKVYLAHDSVLDQDVAIKILKLGLASKNDRDRFLFEARVGAKLRHPNIVTVFDIIQTPEGLQMIMEYYPRGTLSDLIKKKKNGLRPRQAIDILRQVCQGLSHAHRRSIVHRDIKPANIFFDAEGMVKLGDFGIAANVEGHEHTQTGVIIGTPLYMAPEQAKDSRDVDPRTDIYALGMTLYHMLTGRPPRVLDLELIAPAFRKVIRRATDPDRDQRPVSAQQLIALLDAIDPDDLNASDLIQDSQTATQASPTMDTQAPVDEDLFGVNTPSSSVGAAGTQTTGNGNDAAIEPDTQTDQNTPSRGQSKTGPKIVDFNHRKHPQRRVWIALGMLVILTAAGGLWWRQHHPAPPVEKQSVQEPQPTPTVTPLAAAPTPEPTPQPTATPSPTPQATPAPTAAPSPQPAPPAPPTLAQMLDSQRFYRIALEKINSHVEQPILQRRMIQTAIEDMTRELEQDRPQQVIPHLLLALAHYRLQQMQQARQHFRQAMELNRQLEQPIDINPGALKDELGLGPRDLDQLRPPRLPGTMRAP